MLKPLVALIGLFLIIPFSSIFGQGLKEGKEVNNVVKLGLDNWIWGRGDIAFERRTFNKQSVQLEVGIGIPIKVPTRYTQSFSFDLNDSTHFAVHLQKAIWQVWCINAEYRFYLTKQSAPRGFYLAPYLKYKSRGFNVQGSYTRPDSVDLGNGTYNVSTVSADAHIKGGVRTIGGGLALGYHFIINDRFSIDFSPLGLGFDWHTAYLRFDSNDSGITPYFDDWKNAIEQQIRDVPLIGKAMHIESNNDANNHNAYIKGTLGFPFIAYRANLWIGYSF